MLHYAASRVLKPFHVLLVGAVALLATGCGAGPSFQPVSGKLTIDGKVPANVQVSFYPVDGKAPIASGNVDAGTGRYELTSNNGVGKAPGKGAVAGKYKVVLSVAAGGGGPQAAEAMMAQYSGSGGGDAAKGKSPAMPKAPFKKEFGSSSTSPKEVEVKSGANSIDLDL